LLSESRLLLMCFLDILVLLSFCTSMGETWHVQFQAIPILALIIVFLIQLELIYENQNPF